MCERKEEGGDEYVGDIYHLTHSFWSFWPSYTTILSIIDLINISGALNDISEITPVAAFSHTWITWQKYSSHLVCPWGKVSSQGCHLVLDSSI